MFVRRGDGFIKCCLGRRRRNNLLPIGPSWSAEKFAALDLIESGRRRGLKMAYDGLS
jgi:hypothetical protein